MPHCIWGTRFYTYRVPAWHAITPPFETMLSATEALRTVAPDANYTLAPVFVRTPDGQMVELPERSIVRYPTADDPRFTSFGVVSADYKPVYPLMATEAFDEVVGAKCETLGFLRDGREMFLSVKMPEAPVGPKAARSDKDDSFIPYLILLVPMTGQDALEVRVATVRPVCANTVALSGRIATERYAIAHLGDPLALLRSTLASVYTVAESKVRALQQAYQQMIECPIDGKTAYALTDTLYAAPLEPKAQEGEAPETWLRRLDNWKGRCRTLGNRMQAVSELWQGKVTGGDMPAMQSNLYRWFNCVTELENYRWYSTSAGRAGSVLDGDRGRSISAAFDLAVDHLASVGVLVENA